MYGQKRHSFDGTPSAGKPYGPILEVVQIITHKPIDGPSRDVIFILSDGTWEFQHNLKVVCAARRILK